MKIKVTQRLTYPEARKEYQKQTPDFTFLKIVQSMPQKPESKTASTQYSEKDCEITESSKVIIARITKQKSSAQVSSSQNNSKSILQKSSLESKSADKSQNQQNSKQQRPIIASSRMPKIKNHNRFGALADDGAMDTDEGTVRSGVRGSRPRSPVKAPK